MTEIFVIALCLILNAILSCIEMAFVTVSKAHIKKLAASGQVSAKRVLVLKTNPERTLSVLQIGITLVGAISAAVTGAGAQEYLSPYFMGWLNTSAETSEFIAIALVVLPLTYLSVVIGELVPKSIALRFPLKIALSGGYILIFLDRLFYPFVFLLEGSTKFFTKFIFSRFKSESGVATEDGVDLDNLSEANRQYVFNLINIDKRMVKDVMVPWDEVSTIYNDCHQHEILQKIKEDRYTRLPVINRDGTIIGILHAKEFVSESEITKIDWNQLIRSAMYLTPKEPILNALKKMQNNKSHLAVILQDQEPIGIVTIEDIFEEVVGDLHDEDDQPNAFLALNSKIRAIGLNK
jgi:putative hemolysin